MNKVNCLTTGKIKKSALIRLISVISVPKQNRGNADTADITTDKNKNIIVT